MAEQDHSRGYSVDDSIDRFLDEQDLHGRGKRTIDAYERVLRSFEEYVAESAASEISLDSVASRTCMEWVHSLRIEHKQSTIASYATYVNRFYEYMVTIDEFSHNPMKLAMEEMSEAIESDPVRRDISISRMRDFVLSISHSLDRAVVSTFLKTGIRVGELCNLDLRDISCDIPPQLRDKVECRGILEDHSAAVYVDNTPEIGRSYNGEVRQATNKRQRPTIIPIDAELRSILLKWLAIRPDSQSESAPLFVDTVEDWGKRLDPDGVRYRIRTYARDFGWYSSGSAVEANVTPHYFRHFFTTHLRDRVGDRGIVKYLRGDVAEDVIDTYTHDWGDRVARHYRENIFSILSD